MTNPYADIRRSLVEGIRNNPDKPMKLKREAEILIGAIDANDTPQAIQWAYTRFARAAEGAPKYPELVPFPEIAKVFGLGQDDTPQ